MHEVSIMQNAMALARETAKSKGAQRIHALRLRVGAMSGVVPDALQFAFDMVTQGTMAEGASLEIESVPARCWCAECQLEFDSEDFLGECPKCGQLSSELRSGTELEIASVELS